MKTTAFQIFASCVAIVCLASSPVTRAAPALKSVLGTSENPIVQKQGIKDKYLVGLNFVDIKPHHSRLIANEVVQIPAVVVHEPTVSQKLHRQLRNFDPKVENRLEKELVGKTSDVYVDPKEADPALPDQSNEFQDSQQSNEVQNSQSNEVQNSQSNEIQSSQQSDEIQNSQQSDEIQNSQQSDEVQNSQSDEVQNSQSDEVQNSQSNEVQNSQSDEAQDSQLDEDYQESNDVYKYREFPKSSNSHDSYEDELSKDPEEDFNDDEERNTLKPTPLLRTAT